MGTVWSILSGLLLIPYFGVGIYTLRQRFRYHEEPGPYAEGTILLALAVWFYFEISLMRTSMRETPVSFIFAVLGLFVSATALYGPMAVSFASHLFVELISPEDKTNPYEPRYGPAEALERRGDYEGAIGEYMVIARLFPKDPKAPIRIADNYMKLNRPKQAAPWLEHGFKRLDSPDASLRVANRLCDIYDRLLGQQDKAAAVLEIYLQRFPDAEYVESVRNRLKRIAGGTACASNH